jgi:hypothetical protein
MTVVRIIIYNLTWLSEVMLNVIVDSKLKVETNSVYKLVDVWIRIDIVVFDDYKSIIIIQNCSTIQCIGNMHFCTYSIHKIEVYYFIISLSNTESKTFVFVKKDK